MSNAGGVNVEGCANAVAETARSLGIGGMKIGVITGDDILPRLGEFLDRGVAIDNMDTGESLAGILDKVQAGLWRLEIYPDAVPVRDPFEPPSPGKIVTRAISRSWPNTRTPRAFPPNRTSRISWIA